MEIDLERFNSQFALVVGDMMVDQYIFGVVERISPEAPVPVLKQERVERKLGGAGNVIVNINALGARVRAIGRVGNDEEGEYFRSVLTQNHAEDCYVFSEGRTVVKTRIIASNQQFIRVDDEQVCSLKAETLNAIRNNLCRIFDGITTVILSDYGKGFLSEELTQLIIGEARLRRIPVLVDPKGKNTGKYRGATAITPNNKEFLELTGATQMPDETGIWENGKRLCEENDLDQIIFTRSEKGISVISSKEKIDFPAEKKEVVDVTGAGDTVVSTIALGLGVGFSVDVCAILANIAASIVISKFGAAQATLDELAEELRPYEKNCADTDAALAAIKTCKAKGKRIVFTNGCFDIVHAGHVSSFRQAKQFGDILVVGLNSDASIRRIKGISRPIVSLPHRKVLLEALSMVDFVIPFEEDTPQKLIEEIRPDVLVKGTDWKGKEVAGARFVESYGGSVEFIELEQGLSTTAIVEKIKRQ